MEIPIIVEPAGENFFRASSGGLWGLESEVSTDEAVQKLRESIPTAWIPAPRFSNWKFALACIRLLDLQGCSKTIPCSSRGRTRWPNIAARLNSFDNDARINSSYRT